MLQLVKGITRLDPPRMLDPIITTLGPYYQVPEIHPPLSADPDGNGRPSDHLIPIMRPINQIENRCSRTFRTITIRPVPESGMMKLRAWIQGQDWSDVLNEALVDKKAELLLAQLREAVNNFLPEKVIKIASD